MTEETIQLAERFMAVIEQAFRRIAHQNMMPSFKQTLNVSQLRALHHLYFEPGLSQRELAEKLGITPAAVSTAIRELELAGLAERQSDPDDGRLMRWRLTSRAKEFICNYQDQRRAAMQQLLSPLPIEEQRHIVEALEGALKRDAL